MQKIQTLEQAGPDKILHLAIPVEEPNRRYQVTVLVQPVAEGDVPAGALKTGWPPDFLDSVVGAWQGDFQIDFEGDYEQREQL